MKKLFPPQWYETGNQYQRKFKIYKYVEINTVLKTEWIKEKNQIGNWKMS